MPVIDTLVPQTLKVANGWVSQQDCSAPANFGTLVGVTSDDDDDTFARRLTDVASGSLSLSLGTHMVPADHQRHLIRIRSRWTRANPFGMVARIRGARVNTSPQGFFTFIDFTSSLGLGSACDVFDRATAWTPSGFPGDVDTEFLYFVNSSAPTLSDDSAAVGAAELRMDIDCRNKPVFTAQVLDGAGTTTTPITDTTTPTFAFDSIDFDGLNGRTWRVFLYTLAETMLGGFAPFDPNFTTVDEFEGNGPPPTTIPGQPIPNGDYVAYFQAFSTIRVNDSFTSDIESVAFTMDFTPPDPPDLVVTYDTTDDLVGVCFSSVSPGSPGEPAFDAGVVVTEVQRSDCDSGGEFVRVAVIESQDDCWSDCIFPYAKPGSCSIPDHDCVLSYRVRYWGLVDGILVATDWSTTDTAEVPYPYGENDRLRTVGCATAVICPDRSWGRVRPFGAFQPIAGGLPTVVTGAPGGRDYTLTFPVSDIDPSLPDLADIEAVLAEMTVHYAPTDLPAQWMSPDTESIQVHKLGRLRSYQVSFVATGPPVVATPESFFPE